MKNQRLSLPQSSRPSPPTEAQIAALAYEYYVERGYRDGNDRDDWLRAESMLREQFSRMQSTASQPTETTSESGLRPFEDRENPLARGRRGSASREEIRARQVRVAARGH